MSLSIETGNLQCTLKHQPFLDNHSRGYQLASERVKDLHIWALAFAFVLCWLKLVQIHSWLKQCKIFILYNNYKYFLNYSCGLSLSYISGKWCCHGNYHNFHEYSCDPGHLLNGDSTRACQSNGAWSGSEPTCNSESMVDLLLCECSLCLV